MTDQSQTLSIQHLLDQLHKSGTLKDTEAAQKSLLSLADEADVPIFLRVFAGIGGLIVAALLLAFLGVAEIVNFDSVEALLVWGVVLIALAFGVSRLAGNTMSLKSIVLGQMALCFMGAGKALFVVGLAVGFEASWAVPLGFLLVSLATYHAFGQGVDRFLSPLVTLLAALLVIIVDADSFGYSDILFHLLLVVQLSCAMLIWLHPKISPIYVPLGYAFLLGVAVQVGYLSASHQLISLVPNNGVSAHIHFWAAKVEIGLALALVILFVAGGIQRLTHPAIALALLGVALLASISAPGILFGLMLLLLGHALSRSAMLVLGSLMLIIAIIYFYYNLDVSLLIKSLILMASGLVLLLGAFVIHRVGWDKLMPSASEMPSGLEKTS